MNAGPIDISQLSPEERRALLTQLLLDQAAEASLNPLSYGQQALWFLYKAAPESTAYHILYAARLAAGVHIAALERAAQALVDRHPMLRTTYTTRDGQPRQLTHPHARVHLSVTDAEKWSDARIDDHLDRALARPFDLENGPVLRFELLSRPAGTHILMVSVHHIAVDFWSLDIMFDELRLLYAAEQGGPTPPPPPAATYADYVRQQSEGMHGVESERQWRYWQQQLSGDLPVLNLPSDRDHPATNTFRGALHPFTLSARLTRQVRDLARAEGATVYATVLAAFFVLLHRYSGQTDIMVGSPMAARPRADLQGVVGYFTNPVVLRADLSGDPTFSVLLGRVRATALMALDHQDYPFSLLVERLAPARELTRTPFFRTSFVWDKPRRLTESPPHDPASLHLDTLLLRQGGAPSDLMMILSEGDTLTGAVQYSTELFDADTAARIVGHFETLLGGIVGDPSTRLSDLPLLTRPEYRQLSDWQARKVDDASEQRLHRLIEAQAHRSPDAVAVTCADQELTYRELDQRASQLARYLRTRGVGPETPVGICLERSLDLVVGLLAVLKAGGAFVPLDPDHPAQRLRAIRASARVTICLVQKRFQQHLSPSDDDRLICIDEDWETIAGQGGTDVECGTTPDNLAYVMHTSGSTGDPKGVLITHRAICNRLLWMQAEYQLTADDRVLQKTPISFDVAVWEFFWPLLAGARLVVAEPGGHRDSGYLARTIVERAITTTHFVPSMLHVFLADPAARSCRSLRLVFCSGEALPAHLAGRFAGVLHAELHNLYGPTEAAIDVTYHDCRDTSAGSTVPIGRPIASTQIYLLDRHLHQVPVGVIGELYIGGTGLARGYANRPSPTAASFLPNPSGGRHGERIYRTGDLARYLPDGAIEFRGRSDRQVKIRGVRIELDEVTIVLEQHPEVSEAVVTARANAAGDGQLVAYLVATHDPAPSTTRLREFIRAKLPDAMVPAVFVVLSALPRTTSGKVDGRALPEPSSDRPALDETYVAPRNRTEEALASVWSQVLAVSRIGVHDEFFALGGASTQSLEVAARASALGLPLTAELIFRHPTIAALAAALADEPANGPTAASPAASPAAGAAGSIGNTVIESIGVYLPPRIVSTDEVLRGCEHEVMLPLEQLTGIRTRRVAGEEEFSIDLASRAVEQCIARSRYRPADIDLLVCCNISRCDAPGNSISFEPSTSVQLQRRFGLDNVVVFDITNACAGMFTGIVIADAFLRVGSIRRAMIVSGEYITHIARTAQKEIEGLLDHRLACLTVGDAGAALILERGRRAGVGFREIDLCTLGRYSSLCVAKLTDRPHGGAIMYTNSIEQTAIAVRRAVPYAAAVMRKGGWEPEDFQHLIMHQTSESSINDGVVAINQLFQRSAAHRGNVVYNLAERGNTASTTHFVAVDDHIRTNRIRSGDNVLFSVTGSGQTVGVAIYTFDDLPDRVRDGTVGDRAAPPAPVDSVAAIQPPIQPRICVEGIGIAVPDPGGAASSVRLATRAAELCLAGSAVDRGDVGLILHAGVYRDEFLSEPAIAALVAGRLEINDDVISPDDRKTLAFDVLNGGLGVLNACHVATQMISAGRGTAAMIVASEIENNSAIRPGQRRGVREVGSAIMLRRSDDGTTGFGRFLFTHHTERQDALASYTRHENGTTYLHIDRDPKIDRYFLEQITDAVTELLRLEGLDRSMIKAVLPPQISAEFRSDLSTAIGIDRDRVVDVGVDGTDYFTSSTAFGLRHVRTHGLVQPGDVGLIIAVGSGIQTGCATYYF